MSRNCQSELKPIVSILSAPPILILSLSLFSSRLRLSICPRRLACLSNPASHHLLSSASLHHPLSVSPSPSFLPSFSPPLITHIRNQNVGDYLTAFEWMAAAFRRIYPPEGSGKEEEAEEDDKMARTTRRRRTS